MPFILIIFAAGLTLFLMEYGLRRRPVVPAMARFKSAAENCNSKSKEKF
ncbi:MAG: hypothetical protein ABNG97_08945 [Sulfitobacter sp.]|jgi:hypothetical protein|tara:strand:- start:330 stop:476 length:147 start_codon:yes stop_codon:yes gene_type:complete